MHSNDIFLISFHFFLFCMHSNDIFLISFHFFLFCLSVLKPGHIFTKSQKRPAKKVNKCQTWINNVHVWDLLILVIVRVLCILKILILCRHCHLCVSVVTQIRFQCCHCCNVKYDMIKKKH